MLFYYEFGEKGAGASVLLLPYYMINDTVENNINIGINWNTVQVAGLMSDGGFTGLAGSDQWHPSDKGLCELANAIARHLIEQ